MAEFNDKLNSLLSNPDAMSQIMQLAQSLGGGGAQESAPPPPPDQPGGQPGGPAWGNPPQAAPPPAGGGGDLLSSLLGGGGLDMGLLTRLLPLIQELGGQRDSNARNLLYALRPYLRSDRQEKVERALAAVGLLPEFASRFPHEFSGGQRQRIGIARALIMGPEFIIADEPISALDVSIRAQVLNLLARLQKERDLTYLFVAHDLSVMRFITDRIAVIHKGVIVELSETEKLFAHPLHPYTRALLSAIPLPDPIREREKVLEVYDPDRHDYSTDGPVWTEIEPGHFVLGNQAELNGYREQLAR